MSDAKKPDQPTKPKTGPGKGHGKGGGKSKRPGRPVMDSNGKASRGRPPALTKEIHDAIIYNIAELSMPETVACQAEGFDPSLVGKWKLKGAESLANWAELTTSQRSRAKPYIEFFESLRDAKPRYIKSNLAIIKKAADAGDWRAADRRLAFADPATYGKRMMVGNDPKHPLPPTTVLGGVLILPDNRRLQSQAPKIPVPAPSPEKTDGNSSGTQGV